MVVWYASQKREEAAGPLPATDPLMSWRATDVAARHCSSTSGWSRGLILVQILMGVVTAHYGVEGDGFYGIPLASGCPTA